MGINFSGLPMSQGYGSLDKVWATSDARYKLMSQVRPDMTPAEIGFMGALDKRLALENVQAKVQYEYMTAWTDANMRHYQKEQERKRARLASGVIFGY